jgi:hypothetical protein
MLVREPPEHEEERLRGRSIEPVEVVDCDEDRRVGRERLEDVEDGEADCARVHVTVAAGSFEQERSFERASAGFVERLQHVGHHRAQQLADPCEGEDGFGLDRAVREHLRSAYRRSMQPGLPERRLADSRLAREHEHRRRGRRALEEVLQRPQLVLAPAELADRGHRRHSPAKPRPRCRDFRLSGAPTRA